MKPLVSRGCSLPAIRRYEAHGVVPAPGRNGSGYREYRSNGVDLLHFVRQLRSLELPLDDVRDIVHLPRPRTVLNQVNEAATMDITLQYFDGCPNWKTTDRYLATLLEEGAIDATVHHQLIDTPEAAAEHGFRGSPTALIDGTDPFADPDAPVGLSCRIYITEDGPAGSPTLDQLRRAVSSSQTGA